MPQLFEVDPTPAKTEAALVSAIADPRRTKQVFEIGTAAVRNSIELATRWFAHDMS